MCHEYLVATTIIPSKTEYREKTEQDRPPVLHNTRLECNKTDNNDMQQCTI